MEITKGNKLGRQGGSSSQEQPRMEIMKGDKGRQGGSGTTTISGFLRSATQSWRSKNPYSFQLSGEWSETNEEGRLGAAAISVISMQGDWESACRETNEGRQMKKGDFGNQHAGRQRKGDKWRGGDFGNQHAGRQVKGDKWRRETRSGSDFGNQHAGRQMKGDKWRRETRSGSDFGNQHAGRQMKGDKWRRENRSGSDFGNQQPNLWEVRTPIASSYLGKKHVN